MRLEEPKVPTEAVVHTPREKPRGLDWDSVKTDERTPESEVDQRLAEGLVRSKSRTVTDRTKAQRARAEKRVGDGGRRGANNRTLTAEQWVEIKRRYENGEGSLVLARAYGVSDGSITTGLKALGVEMRTKSEAAKLQWVRGRGHSQVEDIDGW